MVLRRGREIGGSSDTFMVVVLLMVAVHGGTLRARA